MPPRTAYSPVSRTVPVRAKPFISSHATSEFMLTALPGAAENVSAATRARGGTRCRMALTVVETRRGRSSEERERVRRANAVMRWAVTAALGEMRS